MTESGPDFDSELRIPLGGVVVLLMALGWFAVIASQTIAPGGGAATVVTAVTVQILALAAFWLDRRHKLAGRALALAILTVLIYLGNAWLGLPGFLTLLVTPVILAAGLIGYPATLPTAGAETPGVSRNTAG